MQPQSLMVCELIQLTDIRNNIFSPYKFQMLSLFLTLQHIQNGKSLSLLILENSCFCKHFPLDLVFDSYFIDLNYNGNRRNNEMFVELFFK